MYINQEISQFVTRDQFYGLYIGLALGTDVHWTIAAMSQVPKARQSHRTCWGQVAVKVTTIAKTSAFLLRHMLVCALIQVRMHL